MPTKSTQIGAIEKLKQDFFQQNTSINRPKLLGPIGKVENAIPPKKTGTVENYLYLEGFGRTCSELWRNDRMYRIPKISTPSRKSVQSLREKPWPTITMENWDSYLRHSPGCGGLGGKLASTSTPMAGGGGEGPGPTPGSQHHPNLCQKRPRRCGPAAGARDAARRTAWLQGRRKPEPDMETLTAGVIIIDLLWNILITLPSSNKIDAVDWTVSLCKRMEMWYFGFPADPWHSPGW